jgi:predicted nucleotidyltransferase component of viral defense system
MIDSIDINYMPENTFSVFQQIRQQSFISSYVMVGGTALAIQIKHRLSEDLDFLFDGDELNINQIKRNFNKLFPNHRIIRQDHNLQIDMLVNEVKVTFFSSGAVAIPFNVRQDSFVEGKLNIASAQAIAAMKFSAIAQQNTIRDYYDLYFLSRYYFPLIDLIIFSKQEMPNLSPVTYTETLVYTKDIEEDDIASHLSPAEIVSKDQIAAFFTEELRKIKEQL